MAELINFAYGSNMLLARLRERVPLAKPLGVAKLKGHTLKWHKVAKDGSGKCDIVTLDDQNQSVLGVLYEIPEEQKPELDRAEGLGHGYAEKTVVVEVGALSLKASAYYATNIRANLAPYTWYRALVVAGAVANKLPAEYIELLRSTVASQDSDSERHAKNMLLAGDA